MDHRVKPERQKCPSCPRTGVGHVSGLNIKPGDDDLKNPDASWLFEN
jgi:hypothetical protein